MQITLSLVAGAASFVFFMLLYFPLDSIVSDYLANLEAQTKGRYRVTYSEMAPSLIFDSVFEDFRLEQKNGEAYEEIFAAKRIEIGVSLFGLISSSLNASFDARLKQGEVEGSVEFSEDSTEIDVTLSKVGLASLGALEALLKRKDFSVGIKGQVDGEIYANLARSVEDTVADFRIRVSGFQLADISVNVQNNAVSVPDMTLSPKDSFALFEGSLEGGRLTLKNVSIPGGDLELQIKGTVNFGRDFAPQRFGLRGRFALSEGLFEKVPVLVILNEHKTADGFFPLNVSGTGAKPQIRIGNFNLSEMLNL